MQEYGKLFAMVYNRRWRGFAQRVAPFIRQHYECQRINEQNRTVLDVACGTGQLLLHFLEYGYQAMGLDQSADMLAYAKENTLPYLKAGRVLFTRANMASFGLDRRFGLVVSTFDALNHLTGENALHSCFQSVYDALVEGGVFIFDLNTRRGLMNQWNGLNVEDTEELLLVNRGIYDGGKQAYTRITGFIQREDGLYERFAETFFNTAFEVEGVLALLKTVGFSTAYPAELETLAVVAELPEKLHRVFFVAQK